MGGQNRAVAGQGQAQGLGQTVHRIGGEHARTGAAGRAGRALDGRDLFVAVGIVGCCDHGIDQIERDFFALEDNLSGLHGPARDEDRGDIDPHGSHQHTGRDLVAIGDADHGVGAVGIDHIFDAVGDQLARRQAVEHAVMAHGDTVIDRDGVELFGNAARLLNFARNQLAEILEVYVTGHELGERIDHSDDRLTEVAILHTGSPPEATRPCHVAAVGRGT